MALFFLLPPLLFVLVRSIDKGTKQKIKNTTPPQAKAAIAVSDIVAKDDRSGKKGNSKVSNHPSQDQLQSDLQRSMIHTKPQAIYLSIYRNSGGFW